MFISSLCVQRAYLKNEYVFPSFSFLSNMYICIFYSLSTCTCYKIDDVKFSIVHVIVCDVK